MRYAVLVLAIIGCLGAGFLGTKWLSDASSLQSRVILKFIRTDPEVLVKDQDFKKEVAQLEPNLRMSMEMALAAPESVKKAKTEPKYQEMVSKLEGAIRASYFLLAALPLGLAGGTVGFFRHGYI